MASRDGDGWVACRCGHRHWGLNGAAGLVLFRPGDDGPEVLLQHRASWVHDGGTWAVPGGARDSHEDPVQAALREADEEVGLAAGHVQVRGTVTGTDHEDWRYDYVLASTTPQTRVHAANAETADLSWVPVARVPGLPLHAGLARDWDRLADRVRTASDA
ncbi:NUDIX domain-containing protein [Jannaschia sp. R86511]|uniref:NUDIX hydrolase n=1 Tax=Jannaschia sp. R86511 TaxID=3093853 RepID=UPI0036D3AC6F